MKSWRISTDDRVLNAELGMRNAERKKRQSFEFGIGNAECGIEIGKMSDFYI